LCCKRPIFSLFFCTVFHGDGVHEEDAEGYCSQECLNEGKK
jgi:hypothetical protein